MATKSISSVIVVGMVIVAFLSQLANANSSTHSTQTITTTKQSTTVVTTPKVSTSSAPSKSTTPSSAGFAIYSVSLLIGASLFAMKIRE